MTKDGRTCRAELRDRGRAIGCELQILLNGELRDAQLYPTRDRALAEAATRMEALTLKAWVATV